MGLNVTELETADYDLLENIKAALYRMWKLKVVYVIATLIGICVFFLFVGIVGNKTTYRSTASIYSVAYGSYEDSSYGVKVMNTYAGLLGTSHLCDRAAEALRDYGISSIELQNMVNSGRIYLSGASSDSKSYGYRLVLVVSMERPDYIVEITNAMAQAFTDEINDLAGVNTLQVLNRAYTTSAVQSINYKLFFLLFAAAGFMISAIIVFAIEFFSQRVYTVGQCEQNEELILGMIPISKER